MTPDKPFDYFYCDICGEKMKANDGLLIFRWEDVKIEDMKIIHRAKCDLPIFRNYSSLNLEGMCGSHHLGWWLELFAGYAEFGKIGRPCEYDVSFLTCFARCQIPYLEEARLYGEEIQEMYEEPLLWRERQSTLKEIIKYHDKKENK